MKIVIETDSLEELKDFAAALLATENIMAQNETISTEAPKTRAPRGSKTAVLPVAGEVINMPPPATPAPSPAVGTAPTPGPASPGPAAPATPGPAAPTPTPAPSPAAPVTVAVTGAIDLQKIRDTIGGMPEAKKDEVVKLYGDFTTDKGAAVTRPSQLQEKDYTEFFEALQTL